MGNGWSLKYYKPHLMKKHGILFGCNKAFIDYPLDYVVAQDSSAIQVCSGAKCNKVLCQRKRSLAKTADPKTTFLYGFGRYAGREGNGDIELCNSGCLAFQIIHYLGFDRLIIVGCDCVFIEMAKKEPQHNMRSNVYEDRQAGKIFRRPGGSKRLERRCRHGKKFFTNSQLIKFSDKFNQLYERFKGDMDIYQLGKWGLLDIPTIEWEKFWSDTHPDATTRRTAIVETRREVTTNTIS